MSLTPEQQRAIIEKESAWTDENFGQLDLSAFPALAPQPVPETHDSKFAREWNDTGLNRSAADLRAFIENPDLESLARVGSETGITDYIDEVRDRKGELEAIKFKRLRPDYLQTDRNYRSIVEVLSFNHLTVHQQNGSIKEQMDALCAGGFWTAANLVGAYDALNEEGALDVAAGTARQLSSSETLDVSRLAQNGKQFEAIDRFLQYSLPDEDPGVEILTDPAYRDLLDTAVLYVWELAQEDYSPTAERREFIQNFAAGRPLTLTLVGSAWAACQENEKRHLRGELLEQYQRPEDTAPPTQKALDNMGDAEFERLYRDSIRAYAQSVRGSGVLA
jgi:hypothetical protein